MSSTVTARDPRLDPQPGDVIEKHSPSGGETRIRTVTKRVDNNIHYRDQTGKERVCWIASWLDWARMATLPGQATEPGLKAKQLMLDRCERFAENSLLVEYKDVTREELEHVLRGELVSEGELTRAFRTGLRRLVMRLTK